MLEKNCISQKNSPQWEVDKSGDKTCGETIQKRFSLLAREENRKEKNQMNSPLYCPR